MLLIRNITIKNFLSIGAVTQSVNFENKDLVLVLGENLDLGGHDNRNGVGKSTIVNALSYALYGVALTNIKKSNLINKTNGKNMLVTLDFSVDGSEYRIERGRGPNKFSFFIDGTSVGEDETDEAQGDSRLTQVEVERVIGIGHSMFKNIVALNTYSEPFLSMRAGDQREIIEHLLGITKLSEKAALLKESVRETKDAIKEEEYRLKAVAESNKRLQESIESLTIKSRAWEKNHQEQIKDTAEAISVLQKLDVEDEITKHRQIAIIREAQKDLNSLKKEIGVLERQRKDLFGREADLAASLKKLRDESCPLCGHALHDEEKRLLLETSTEDELNKITERLEELKKSIDEITKEAGKLEEQVVPEPATFYDSAAEAYDHRSSLDSLINEHERETIRENPYEEQITELKKSGLQEVDYSTINELSTYRDHQEFLLRLLVNKDSFIRRKIIDQNLSYLNSRLDYYLIKLGLPHKVKFLSDLNVEITEHGRDLDFDNLSRGERTRLILSLSFSFRDVFESLNAPISLLFIDELIDSGLDTSGVESALSVLKKMSRDSKKNIFLISHKDELIGRVDNVLRVVKEGGFTSVDEDADIT